MKAPLPDDVKNLELLIKEVVRQAIAEIVNLPLEQRQVLLGMPPMPSNFSSNVAQEWDTAERIAGRMTALGQGQITKSLLEKTRRQHQFTLDIHYRLKSREAKTPQGRRFEYSFTACCKYFGIKVQK